MSLEQGAKLRQAVETAFQYIASRVAHHYALIMAYSSPRVKAVQLLVSSKKVVGEALDVPDPRHQHLNIYIPFNHSTENNLEFAGASYSFVSDWESLSLTKPKVLYTKLLVSDFQWVIV